MLIRFSKQVEPGLIFEGRIRIRFFWLRFFFTKDGYVSTPFESATLNDTNSSFSFVSDSGIRIRFWHNRILVPAAAESFDPKHFFISGSRIPITEKFPISNPLPWLLQSLSYIINFSTGIFYKAFFINILICCYYMSRKQIPILYSKLLHKIGHYF